VNPEMVDNIEAAGLRFVGKDETGRRMEVFPELRRIITIRSACWCLTANQSSLQSVASVAGFQD